MERGTVTAFDLFVRDDTAVCILEAEGPRRLPGEAVTGDPRRPRSGGSATWRSSNAMTSTSDAPEDEQIPFMDRIWSFRPDE